MPLSPKTVWEKGAKYWDLAGEKCFICLSLLAIFFETEGFFNNVVGGGGVIVGEAVVQGQLRSLDKKQ